MKPLLHSAPKLAALVAAVAAGLMLASVSARADEDTIRKTLKERMPNMPQIDEISKTPIAGIYEVRFGSDIVYTNENGDYVLEGSLFDTKTKTDLTQARVDKLLTVDFAALPVKDALVFKQGTGARKLAVFADPNCGYCKRLEKDLVNLKDVTIYTYVIPILGADSVMKSRDIVCAPEPTKTWRSWMIDGKVPAKIDREAAKCDAKAVDRVIESGSKYRINSTPIIVFEDGSRIPGAVSRERIEERLDEVATATKKS